MSVEVPNSNILPVSGVRCPICGTASIESYPGLWKMKEDGREFLYRECAACRTLFCDPLPTDEEIRYLYTERYDFEWFRQHRLLKRIQAWHRFLRLGRLLRQLDVHTPARLLDVGCGHGWFLAWAAGRGWECQGVDFLNDAGIQEAQRSGARIQNGSIETAELPPCHFDILTMWHILEHTRDPRVVLRRAAEVLRVGGLCFIAVPNRDAAGLALAGWRWGWLQKPFIHVFGFSECGLRRLLPPNLEAIRIVSRDVWDQQYICFTRPYRVVSVALYSLFRAPRKLFSLLGLAAGVRMMERLHFFADEGLQLLTYAGYLVTRPVWWKYEKKLRGSELLVIARKTA